MENDNAKIDPSNDRYPYCLVWTPIPGITWLLPFVGHMGICSSKGVIYDFAGPYFIGEDDLAFGRTQRYLQLTPSVSAEVWDEAVKSANACYGRKMHNICCQNCHSHCATVLDEVAYGGFRHWNMVILAAWMFFRGKFVSFGSFTCSFLPSIIIYMFIFALVFVSRM